MLSVDVALEFCIQTDTVRGRGLGGDRRVDFILRLRNGVGRSRMYETEGKRRDWSSRR